jgi:hypothetical protein
VPLQAGPEVAGGRANHLSRRCTQVPKNSRTERPIISLRGSSGYRLEWWRRSISLPVDLPQRSKRQATQLTGPLPPAVGLTNVVPAALRGRWWSRFGAAAAQQLCSTKPHEAPPVSSPAMVQCPATQGFVVDVVVGIPGWHARAQSMWHWRPPVGATPSRASELSGCYRSWRSSDSSMVGPVTSGVRFMLCVQPDQSGVGVVLVAARHAHRELAEVVGRRNTRTSSWAMIRNGSPRARALRTRSS